MSSYHMEVGIDDQVEDGEMESPNGDSPMQLSKDNAMFSMSDEENEDTTDSLDIKPPQAKSYHARTSQPSSRSSSTRREKHGERSDSRREHSSSHSHASVKGESSMHYSSRKGHHHSRSDHRERRNEGQSSHEKKHSHRERREAASRGVDGGRGASSSEAARLQEIAADHKLDDLRKRLLDKRKRGESSRHAEKRQPELRDSRIEYAPEPRETRPEQRETRIDSRGEQREIRKERGGDGKELRMERTSGWPEEVEHRDFREPPVSRHESRRPEERPVESRRPDERKVEIPSVEHKRSEEHRERRERRGEERPPPPEKIVERGEGAPRKEFLLEANRQKEIYRRELEARRERRNMEKEKERTMREIVRKRERSRSRQRKKLKIEEEPEEDLQVSEQMDVVDVSDDSSATDEAAEGEGDGEKEGDDGDGEETEEGEEDEEEDEEEGSSDDSADDDSDSKTDTDTQVAADTDDSPGGDTDEEKVVTSRAPSVSDDDTDSFADRRQGDGQNGSSPGEPTEILEEDVLPPYLPAVSGCRSVEEFQCLNRIEEGTYGVVYRARDRSNDEVVALKRLKMEKEKEGFPITSLREINTLLKAQHLNIVTVREIVVGSNMDKIFIVMDYVEHDLKSLMETMKTKKQVFIPGEVKCLMQQLLRAVSHLHDNWILHRDLKTSNLLLSHKGILKVGDFGLAREYGSPLKAYTPIVVTLWYRSPELLLCTKEYSTPIDLWSVGCIFGEFLSMEALFPGKSEVDQINRIFKDLGTPTDKVWPDYKNLPAVQKMNFTTFPPGQLRKRFGTMITELGIDLFHKFLTYEPASRVTADDALKHGYFEESPLAIDPAMFPTWPAKSELGHRKPGGQASPKPPPGGAGYKQLGDTDERVPDAEGFHMGVTENRRIAMGAGFSLKF